MPPARVSVLVERVLNASAEWPDAELVDLEDRESEGWQELVRWWKGGLRNVYVGRSVDGRLMNVIFLIRRHEAKVFSSLSEVACPPLGEAEVVLDGVYTCARYRRRGVMVDCVHQVLDKAREEGFSTAISHVRPSNVASIRGLARAGFQLTGVALTYRRLGFSWGRLAPPDESAWLCWRRALGAGVDGRKGEPSDGKPHDLSP